MDTWMTEYIKQLEAAVRDYPAEYGFSLGEVPIVASKMRVAFRDGHYNKDVRAVKATCKHFKIAYTYKAINHFIANHE